MSADTRQSQKRKARSVLADLAGLNADAVDLIRKPEARSDEMTARLLRALQLYKEDRLGEVAEISLEHAMTRDERFAAFSTRLDVPQKGLSTQAMKYCQLHGIRYAGEVYMIDFGRSNHAIMDLNAFMRKLGLPEFISFELDPIAEGWRPPYWDDPLVIGALNDSMLYGLDLRMCAILDFSFAIHHLESNGRFRIGDFIESHRSANARSPSSLYLLQKTFVSLADETTRCHAAMILPKDWSRQSANFSIFYAQPCHFLTQIENPTRRRIQLLALTTDIREFVADLPSRLKAKEFFERTRKMKYVCELYKIQDRPDIPELLDALTVLLRYHHLSFNMTFSDGIPDRLTRAAMIRQQHPGWDIETVWNNAR